MQHRANGPYRGSASKDFELVEFADFQCPHCKEAQANMEKLAADYPKARIVFQSFPIPSIHPEAVTAAEYGLCVSKLGSSTAFFQYAAAVFDGQEGLATPDGATLTLNSAVTLAGRARLGDGAVERERGAVGVARPSWPSKTAAAYWKKAVLPPSLLTQSPYSAALAASG